MYITLDHTEALAQDIHTFWFKPHKAFRFIAGQYIEIHVPHAPMDSRGDKRWFSISSTPIDGLVAITMKIAPPAVSSSYKVAFSGLRPGITLYASDPIGDFVLPKSPTIPLVFMALGIGITPFQSMMRSLSQTGESRDIHIVHAATSLNDLIFRDKMQHYKSSTYTPLLLQAPAGWQGLTGRLDARRLLEITHTSAGMLEEKLFYMSGPEPPVLQIIDELYQLGITRQQIVMDYFPGYI